MDFRNCISVDFYSLGAACSAGVALLSYLSQSEYNIMDESNEVKGDCYRMYAIFYNNTCIF